MSATGQAKAARSVDDEPKPHEDQLRCAFVCGWLAQTDAKWTDAKWMDEGKLWQMRMRMP